MSEWRTWKIVGAKAAETIGSADSPDISTAATQTRSLPERLGPTQTIAECSSAIPYWASEWPEAKPQATVSPFCSPSEDVCGMKR